MVDDSPDSSQDDSTRHAVRALNVSEVKQVVPDLTNMPCGWEKSGSLAAGKDESNGCSAAQARFDTNNWNDGTSTRSVWADFTVWSCPSAALTAKGFEETRSGVANNKAREISLPKLGDQRAAITHYNIDLDETTAVALLRVGTVLVKLEYQPVPDDSGWSKEFEQLTSVVAARAQQIQNA
ncbi:hypothetical protein [Streptomyces huasconensis]|uniref:hypothetical protein n=1 Tax=Streptomyces huasconensis TaxID=1854574 RepID=UPI0034093FA6